MAVALYFDVHVPQAIADQLRRRDVDLLTAIEDEHRTVADTELLERARALRRVMFTQDIRFKAMAELWQREGRLFEGLVFGHQMRGTIGRYIRDLELIAKGTDLPEWRNAIVYLPL